MPRLCGPKTPSHRAGTSRLDPRQTPRKAFQVRLSGATSATASASASTGSRTSTPGRVPVGEPQAGQLEMFSTFNAEQYSLSPDFRRQLKARTMKYDVRVQILRGGSGR